MMDEHLRQDVKPLNPGLRAAVLDGAVTRYVPIAGTHGFRDAWCMENTSPFARMMTDNHFAKILTSTGRPFRWSTDLNGLFVNWKFWDRRNSDWEAGADALFYFLDQVPYRDRNVIAHSHGGQVAIIAAAWGLQLRTLTTVSTPVRADVPAAAAARNIGMWQHIYDRRWDAIGLAGQAGDLALDGGRAFNNLDSVLNRPLASVSHSKVLRDERFVDLWTANGYLEAIRRAPVSPIVAAS